MVQSADARQGDDLGAGQGPSFGLPAAWGVADRRVDALSVVVVDVLAEKTSQMALAEHDYVVEKLSANAAHGALSYPVLPRVPERRTFRSVD